MRETSLLLRARLVVSLSGPGNLLVGKTNPESREDTIKETFPGPQAGLYSLLQPRKSEKVAELQSQTRGKKQLHFTKSEQSRAEKGFVFKTFVLIHSTDAISL